MLDAVIYWIRQYQIEFFWLLFFPVLTFLLGVVMMLVVIGRLPENYFLQSKIVNGSEPNNTKSGIHVLLLKNIVGIFLVCLGILMLFLPGPGLLTTTIGLVMVDMPGKKRMLIRVLRVKSLRTLINRIRDQRGRPHFKFDD